MKKWSKKFTFNLTTKSTTEMKRFLSSHSHYVDCNFLWLFLHFPLIFLFRYLHEIGYTDTIIDIRSNHVRSLLGLHDAPGNDAKDENRINNAINGGDSLNATTTRRNDNNASSASGSTANRRGVASTLAEEMMIDTEAAVMANFDFLSSEVCM